MLQIKLWHHRLPKPPADAASKGSAHGQHCIEFGFGWRDDVVVSRTLPQTALRFEAGSAAADANGHRKNGMKPPDTQRQCRLGLVQRRGAFPAAFRPEITLRKSGPSGRFYTAQPSGARCLLSRTVAAPPDGTDGSQSDEGYRSEVKNAAVEPTGASPGQLRSCFGAYRASLRHGSADAATEKNTCCQQPDSQRFHPLKLRRPSCNTVQSSHRRSPRSRSRTATGARCSGRGAGAGRTPPSASGTR